MIGWIKMAAPSLQIKSEGADEGQKYLAVTAGANRVEASHKITNLVEGKTYILSFSSRGNTSKDARIIRKNASSSYLALITPSQTAEWATQTLKFVATGREALLQISVRSAGAFDVDDFVIKRGN